MWSFHEVWSPGKNPWQCQRREASVHITYLSHATVLYDLINYVLWIYSLILCWRQTLGSDWDQIFQRSPENNSHALRSININPWLVYFLFWNIHSCFCHFRKKWNKLPSEAVTRRYPSQTLSEHLARFISNFVWWTSVIGPLLLSKSSTRPKQATSGILNVSY